MTTWFILGAVCLFIPVLMIAFAIIFLKKTPNTINPVYGYRSRRSMKSKEAWKFAHYLCAKIWLFTGISLLVISIVAMLLVLNKPESTIGLVGQILIYSHLVIMILSIIPVEIALKRNFDENGNKIEK